MPQLETLTEHRVGALMAEYMQREGVASVECLSRGMGNTSSWPCYVQASFADPRRRPIRKNFNLSSFGDDVEAALKRLNASVKPGQGELKPVPNHARAPKKKEPASEMPEPRNTL